MSLSSSSPTFKVGLTADEKQFYSQLFKSLDPESTGIVTGDKARLTFEKSGLSPAILGEIWQLADHNNLGFLTQFGFCFAMRLIGQAQSGKRPTAELAEYSGPLPKFANLSNTTSSMTLQPQVTENSLMQTQPSSHIPLNSTTSQHQPQDSLSAVDQVDIQKFSELFVKTVGSPYGELNGPKARDIFLKAKLPTSTLGQIWSLVDRNNSGKLGINEFIIAMYLIQGLLSGVIKQLPPFLSESIWQSLRTNGSPNNNTRQVSYGSVSSSQTTVRHPSSELRTAGSQTEEWAASSTMRQQYASIFDNLDKSKSGKLSPDQVASFLMTSKLSQQDLASIWDLSDIQNTGTFTILEFSIAMFLVNKRLSGEDLPNIVPESLLHSLKQGTTLSSNNGPSSQRQESWPQDSAPVSQIQKPIEKQKTAMDDLVDVFGSSNSTPVPGPVQDTQKRASSSDLSHEGVKDRSFGGFKPTSSFGQSLMQGQSRPSREETSKETRFEKQFTPQRLPETGSEATLDSTPSDTAVSTEPKNINYDALRSVPPPLKKTPSVSAREQGVSQNPGNFDSARVASPIGLSSNDVSQASRQSEDLLADKEISGQLSQATTDIANVSNQIKSLTSQTSSLQDKKSKADAELNKILSTKKDIDSKLKQLRSSYQHEVKQMELVDSHLASAREEAEALRSETSIAEARFNSLSTELQEKKSDLEQLQSNNRGLKERLGHLNSETAEIEGALTSVSADNEKLSKQVSVRKSQVQVAIARVQEMKSKIQDLHSSNRALQSEHDEHGQRQLGLENDHKDLSSRLNDITHSQQQTGSNSSTRSIGAAAGIGAGIGALAGGAEIARHYNSNVSGSDYGRNNENREVGIPDEAPSHPRNKFSSDDSINEADDVATRTLGQREVGLENKFNDLSVNDRANIATMSSSTTDFKDNEDETPVTSPNTSEYQFPNEGNAGIVGGMVGMPGVLVGVQRTDSLTSSIQNNASLSVRDDNIEEISDRETLGNGRQSVQPEVKNAFESHQKGAYNEPGAVHRDDSSEADKLSSGVESFELVNAEEARSHESKLGSHNEFEKNRETIVIKNPITNRDDANNMSTGGEFPPIKELGVENASSDSESKDDRFDDAVDMLPNNPSNSNQARYQPESRNDFDSAFDDLAPASNERESNDDLFGDDFEGLEAADDDDIKEDEFNNGQNFGFSNDFTDASAEKEYHSNAPDFSIGSSSNPNDEWEKLFAGFGNSKVDKENALSGHTLESQQEMYIEELKGMGFDEATSLDALKRSNWNIEEATNYLLDNA